MMKRILTVLLLVAMLLTSMSLAACNDTPDDPADDITDAPAADDVTDAPAETEPPVEEDRSAKSDLPADVNFEGMTANILVWQSSDNEFYSETDSGEVISSSIYWRNLNASERLKLEILWNTIPGNAAAIDSYTKTLESACMSGDTSYDLMAAYARTTASCAVAGLLQDIGGLDYVDLDKKYYLQPSVEVGTIGNKTYFLTGDMCHSFLARQSVVIFNNDLIQRYNLEDPYDIVLSGKWTVDKMAEMTSGVYEDLNSNNQRDDQDLYGIVGDILQVDCTYYAAGLKWVEKNADNMPVLSDDISSEAASNLVDKWINIFQQGGYVVKQDSAKEFESGNAIFWLFPVVGVTRGALKETVDFTFGIVPQPKMDETQENYIGSTTNYFTLWGCPISIQESALSGALLEVLAEEGNKTIIPAVFEQAFKLKYNSDESGRQSQIFDILKSNVRCDMGKIFSVQLYDLPTSAYAGAVTRLNNNYMTIVGGQRRVIERTFNKLIESFQ